MLSYTCLLVTFITPNVKSVDDKRLSSLVHEGDVTPCALHFMIFIGLQFILCLKPRGH